MGRKNRNARSRGYSSFAELKSSTVKFDLSNGSFQTKTRHGGGGGALDADISLSLGNNSRGEGLKYATFSIKDSVAKTMIDDMGSHWTCGIVRQDAFERLYLIPDPLGFALYKNSAGRRHYTRIRIDDYAPFERYIGDHDLQFDEFNKAYFITADR